MRSPLISFVQSAVSRATKFLYRDFFELELARSSKPIRNTFVQKSKTKAIDTLKAELQKHPDVGVITEGGIDQFAESDKINFSINVVDSEDNMTRAIPLFSISILIYKVLTNGSIDSIAVIIEFPILRDVYIIEKSRGGVYLKSDSSSFSLKLKTSAFTVPDLIINDSNIVLENTVETRKFGSISYALCMLASGKVDIVLPQEVNQHFIAIINFFISEKLCHILSEEPLILSNGNSTIKI
jgi:fructose-1,6-bisphosphatase/inositol monophosphatase family enzyme